MAFKKGQSGNPGGRPRRAWTWATEYQKAVERENSDGTPIKQGIAESLVDKALQGDVLAIKELSNRMDGMPQQDIVSDGEKIESTLHIYVPTKLKSE